MTNPNLTPAARALAIVSTFERVLRGDRRAACALAYSFVAYGETSTVVDGVSITVGEKTKIGWSSFGDVDAAEALAHAERVRRAVEIGDAIAVARAVLRDAGLVDGFDADFDRETTQAITAIRRGETSNPA